MVGLIIWAILLIIIGFALLPWWVLPAFAVVLISVIIIKDYEHNKNTMDKRPED